MQPRRMTGQVLRGVARAQRAPVLGVLLREASLALMGVNALRDARLGDVRPYHPEAATGPTASGARMPEAEAAS